MSRMNNTGLLVSNTIPIQYWAPGIAIQYNTNTDAILPNFPQILIHIAYQTRLTVVERKEGKWKK
jgi:hypothetical protein